MERHPDVIPNGIVRKSGEVTPFNAGDAIAATVELCREIGIPVAPQVKARLGKASKGLVDAGFPPTVVVSACVVAIKTGWFGSVESIAQEMVVAQAGERMARSEYQRALAETHHQVSRSESPVWQMMREEMARRANRKESDEGPAVS